MPYIGTSPGTGTRSRYLYTATASQTTFSGADDNSKTLSYADGDYVDVYLNGVSLVPVTDYTATSKTSIVLTAPAGAGDVLEIVAYDIATIADTVSKANGGTFEDDITVNGSLSVIDSTSTDTLTLESSNTARVTLKDTSAYAQGTGPYIQFQGEDSAGTNRNFGQIWGISDTANNGELDLKVRSSGSMLSAMRIDSSGNVGINTISPNYKLETKDDDIAVVKLAAASGGNTVHGIRFRVNNSSNTSQSATLGMVNAETVSAWGGVLTFSTKPANGTPDESVTERMRIDSSGSLQNGDYASNSGATNGYILRQVGGSANTAATFELLTSSTATRHHIAFRSGATSGNSSGAIRGSISTSSTSTSYNTSSDYRLKTDAQPMTGASARVQALNPVNFEWIADGTRVDGFLAHEAQAVVPEAVTGTKDAMRDEEYEVTPAVLDEDGNVVTEAVMGTRSVPDYQGIDQSKLVPLLTAALQEALTKIDDLETRLAALEAN